MTKQIIAYLVAAGLGAGATAVLSLQGASKGTYKVHGLDLRLSNQPSPDGGTFINVTAYAKRQLTDGGYKDVGAHRCAEGEPLQTVVQSLMVASEACIRED